MNVLVIGGSGMLGHKLVQVLSRKFDLSATLRSNITQYPKCPTPNNVKFFEDIDIENFAAVETVFKVLKPEVVINAVGIIKQVSSARNAVKTLTVNAVFPHRLAEIAAQMRARLINISTDCVFNGKKGDYVETDVADAYDLYGKSKHLGEVTEGNCLTLRTSIIGRELNSSHSLLEWFLSQRGGAVKGYQRAVFSGFPTLILAGIIGDIIENHASLNGLYHVSSEPINKFELLKLVKNAYQTDVKIELDTNFVIDRSLNSARYRTATGFVPDSWENMIALMADDKESYQ